MAPRPTPAATCPSRRHEPLVSTNPTQRGGGKEGRLVDELRVPRQQHGGGHGSQPRRRPPWATALDRCVEGHQQPRRPRQHEDLLELGGLRQHHAAEHARNAGQRCCRCAEPEPSRQRHHPDPEQHHVQRDDHAHRSVGLERQGEHAWRVQRARLRVAEMRDPTEDGVVPQRQTPALQRPLRHVQIRPGVRVAVERDDVAPGPPERPSSPQRDGGGDRGRRDERPGHGCGSRRDHNQTRMCHVVGENAPDVITNGSNADDQRAVGRCCRWRLTRGRERRRMTSPTTMVRHQRSTHRPSTHSPMRCPPTSRPHRRWTTRSRSWAV